MNFIRQNTPFVLVWEIELQGTAIKLADTKVSVIASCARGRIDLTDYIDSIEDNTITINQNKGLAFIGDYSLMAIIKSENLTTLKVQEKYVFRAIAKNDPTETESLVSIRSSIVASGGYDSALSEVSQNAIQNAPVAKEFGKVYQAIEDTENSIEQSVEDLLGSVSEAYDTLKEIEKYIEKDEAGAVVLAQNIAKNAKAIEDSPFEKGSGDYSAVLKGGNNKVKGSHSFASGLETEAPGICSHSEGYKTNASGDKSHAEGYNTIASGRQSHAEGNDNEARGDNSHVEGNSSSAQGASSHAEGRDTWANGEMAHAEGYSTKAVKNASHTEGVGTVAENNAGEHAEGKYNKSNEGTLHSVGMGTWDSDRKNAHEIMQNGKHYIYGIGGYDGTNPGTATDLAALLNSSITDMELDNLFNE